MRQRVSDGGRAKNIALYGGSFNPPHEGHREIIRCVARRKTIDEVWVLPVFKHPFHKKMTPFAERLRWCRRAFGDLGPKVKVKDLERRLGGISWTIRLVRHLRKKYLQISFSLILGDDTYRQRNSWKNFPDIRKMVSLIVFPRGPKSPIPDVSSTEIRRNPSLRLTFQRRDCKKQIHTLCR